MMTTRASRAARPIGWMLLGAILAALIILGPRVAVNRALDAGYSLADWLSSLG